MHQNAMQAKRWQCVDGNLRQRIYNVKKNKQAGVDLSLLTLGMLY